MDSLKTKNLSVSYDRLDVIKDLDLTFAKGKITSIVGPNGCGKSTLLKTMGRILKPKSGTIYLEGENIMGISTKEAAKKMAFLPQSPAAPEGICAGELVAYGRFPHRKGLGRLSPEDKKTISWALEVTKLSEYEATPVGCLSGGQRQRVWIAMALAQQTDLILLDEPTTYLDLAYQLEVLELLYTLNKEQGCTVIMVLHDLNLAARFSDYMVFVRSGKMITHGTPEEVMTPEVLGETFGIDALIASDPQTGRPVCMSYNLKKDFVESCPTFCDVRR